MLVFTPFAATGLILLFVSIFLLLEWQKKLWRKLKEKGRTSPPPPPAEAPAPFEEEEESDTEFTLSESGAMVMPDNSSKLLSMSD